MRLTLIFLFYLSIICQISNEQVTYKSNKILSRHKRFLRFPEGSNLIMTASGIKNVMLEVPPGFITLIELDVFFKLPSQTDQKKIKKYLYHFRHRREVYNEMTKVFDIFGFDGNACVRKMVCEISGNISLQQNSLFQQIVFALFKNPKLQNKTDCYNNAKYNKCNISLLPFILSYWQDNI